MDSLSARSGIFISEVMLLSFIHRELYHWRSIIYSEQSPYLPGFC
jgi:hypothetical protein